MKTKTLFTINSRKVFYLLLGWGTLYLLSCRKDQGPDPGPLSSRKEQIISNLDSIYRYALQLYLWNDQLPAVEEFRPGRFYRAGADKEISLYVEELFAFSRYAVSPAGRLPYEYDPVTPGRPKFSSVIAVDEPAEAMPPDVFTSGNGYGIAFAGTAGGQVRLLYVDQNSPAGLAGLKRGQRVVSVNGKAAAAAQAYYQFIASSLRQPQLQLELETVQGGAVVMQNVQLNSRAFTVNPVLKSAILQTGGGKAGYLAYRSFTAGENSRKYLDPVFSRFAGEGIDELIIDLRYNSGGYQNTCRYLADKIAPQSADGKVMFREIYNQLMQQGKASLLANQPLLSAGDQPVYMDGRLVTLLDIDFSPEANTVFFDKTGPLMQLSKVTFIVSGQTASASELLINVLKPYMEVRLVGVSPEGKDAVRTFGKPVGFFDIRVERYKVYMALYKDQNANGEGDFFEGMPADVSVWDDVAADFGDSSDPAVRAALGRETRLGAQSARAVNSVNTAAGSPVYIFPEKGQGILIKDLQDLKLKTKLIK